MTTILKYLLILGVTLMSSLATGSEILVESGQSIQDAVIAGDWPVLEGEKTRNDAVLYSGNGITIENLKIMNYKGNGIMGQAGNNFAIRNNWIIDAGVYAIFPEFATNGVIEHNVMSGIEDAAI